MVFSCALLILMVVMPAAGADRCELPRENLPSAPQACERRIVLPFIHIGALEMGMQVVAGAVWQDAYTPIEVRRNSRQFIESWSSPPEFHFDQPFFGSDTDWWYFNVFAHGLFGSEAYLTARAFGHRPFVATAYVLFASFTWEYLLESWYKRPSAIDLFWTPFSGILLGELRYRAYSAASRYIANRALRRTILVLLDPLGEMERLILGCDAR